MSYPLQYWCRTHPGRLDEDLSEAVESPVIYQTQAAPASKGHEEGDVMLLAVFPGGQDALACQDTRHGEVEARVPDEEVGALGGAPHQSEEALAHLGPLAVSDLGRDSDLNISFHIWHIKKRDIT